MSDPNRSIRKDKPQRKLYKPGSGPLRKSSPERNNSERHNGVFDMKELTTELNSSSLSSITNKSVVDNKKPRKPDTPIYVPPSVIEHSKQQKDDNSVKDMGERRIENIDESFRNKRNSKKRNERKKSRKKNSEIINDEPENWDQEESTVCKSDNNIVNSIKHEEKHTPLESMVFINQQNRNCLRETKSAEPENRRDFKYHDRNENKKTAHHNENYEPNRRDYDRKMGNRGNDYVKKEALTVRNHDEKSNSNNRDNFRGSREHINQNKEKIPPLMSLFTHPGCLQKKDNFQEHSNATKCNNSNKSNDGNYKTNQNSNSQTIEDVKDKEAKAYNQNVAIKNQNVECNKSSTNHFYDAFKNRDNNNHRNSTNNNRNNPNDETIKNSSNNYERRSSDTKSSDTNQRSWNNNNNNSNNQKNKGSLPGKPPASGSVRKHVVLPSAFETLAPRLQKKFMKENGLQDMTIDEVIQTYCPQQPSWNQNLQKRSNAGGGSGGRNGGRGGIRNNSTNNNSNENYAERFVRSLTPERVHYDRGDYKNNNSNSKKLWQPKNSSGKDNNLNTKFDKFNENQSKTSQIHEITNWADEVEREEETHLSRATSRESFVEPAPPKSKNKRVLHKRDDFESRNINNDAAQFKNFHKRNSIRRGSENQYSAPPSRDNSTDRYGSRPGSRNGSIERRYNHYKPNDNYNRRNWRESSVRDDSTDRGYSHNRRSGSSDRRDYRDNRNYNSRDNSLDRRNDKKSKNYGSSNRGDSTERRRGRQNSSGSNRGWGSRNSSMERKKNVPEEELSWRKEMKPRSTGGGIIVLKQPIPREEKAESPPKTQHQVTFDLPPHSPPAQQQKQLYNPNNPNKPIVMISQRRNVYEQETLNNLQTGYPSIPYDMPPRPMGMSWYRAYAEKTNDDKIYETLMDMEKNDQELHYLISTGAIIQYWSTINTLRNALQILLQTMLKYDIKFCEEEHVDQHLWRIMYYGIIDILRKQVSENKDDKNTKQFLINLIDEGLEYFEKLLSSLEEAHNVKFDQVLSWPKDKIRHAIYLKVAAQKIYIFLGDLARYKEQVLETTNYGIARRWYMKANQMNPKNGRPYHQLAILAMYTKRKLDAVYYYMRTLMASNSLPSARDSLLGLFDETHRKYDALEKKREEKAAREKERMKEKEKSEMPTCEIWIHPNGGRNTKRLTSMSHQSTYDSQDEELSSASNIEINKRFSLSYLHVLGKLYTKIGFDSLSDVALRMLKEFRALLQHSPIPLNSTRFLQLMALNMFCLESAQSKEYEEGYKPAVQENALIVSLQMFNIMLERFIQLLKKDNNINSTNIIPLDCQELLPSIKVWCDWLMSHVDVWNPPPSCQDYSVGPPGDCWQRLAQLVNLLSKLENLDNEISTKEVEGYECVHLPEDATLSGFTPLLATAEDHVYVSPDLDMEVAQTILRIRRLLFFGTVYLCGLDPPVLKLYKNDETGQSEYISIVNNVVAHNERESRIIDSDSAASTVEESDEDSGKSSGIDGDSSQSEISVPFVLPKTHSNKKKIKDINSLLMTLEVRRELEVRPYYLVPDTNCFIDHLEQLISILKAPDNPYLVVVPLVVVNELEGLSKNCKGTVPVNHAAQLRESARDALNALKKGLPNLRCATTKGQMLTSLKFINEQDTHYKANDLKILETCINMNKQYSKDTNDSIEGKVKRLHRNVVLLTEDCNLKLMAVGHDVPVRRLPDFVRWAGLG